MKLKTTFLFAFAALLFACGNIGNAGRKIDLTVDGGAGKTAYFQFAQNGKPMNVDSVVLDANGKGILNVPRMPLDFYLIKVDDQQLIVALDSLEELTIETKFSALNQPTLIKGSEETTALHQYYSDVTKFEERSNTLRAAMQDPNNTEAIAELNALNAAFYEQTKEFTRTNSSSPAAIVSVNKLDMNRELPLFKQVRDDLRKTMPKSGLYAKFRDQVAQMEMQETQIKMQQAAEEKKNSMLPIGSIAPEIRQQTPDGGTFALSELRGQYVLIDFWASWCRPCRYENPNVKRIYDRFHKKGFEILGVSLDKDLGAWQKAIADDGLPWKHVSDLGFWNNAAAQEYGVNSIPFTVIVDKEGKILAKGMRANELEPKLEEIFGK